MYNSKIPHSYHISKGADSVFYILNCGEEFVRTLSTNYDTAKKLAVKLIKKNEPDFFKDGNKLNTYIWNRNSWSQTQRPKWLPIQESHIKDYFSHIYKLEYEKKLKSVSHREYVGNVGDTIELELEMLDSFSVATEWGGSWCFKFKDSKDNRFIYFGTSLQLNNFKENGDKFVIKFQIKKQFVDEKYDVAPYKLNQIEKPKSIVPVCREEIVQLDIAKEDISVVGFEYYTKKNIKFYFTTWKNEKVPFYPKGIKSLKDAKKFLYNFNDLVVLRVLTKEILLMENITDYINGLFSD
tara:strand:- start:50 stop:934 length:885 start_codon:yes stop_codon:yes gene_type:complete